MAESTRNGRLTGGRIRAARLAKGLSQEELGELLYVSFQAVSTWETGKCLPDTDHLPALAKALDLSLDSLFAEEEKDWEMKPVNFDAGHMFTFVKGRAQMLRLTQTLNMLDLLRTVHGGQERTSLYGFQTSCMVHPLTLACHALAMGLKDDDVLAVCLAHDMAEDAGFEPEELPVNENAREAVRLLSKNKCSPKTDRWEDRYYENIRKNPPACLVKCLDRVNNLAGMADAFDRNRMISCIRETDRYYPALLETLKKIPEWNDAWWLLRYQMTAMLETFKRIL